MNEKNLLSHEPMKKKKVICFINFIKKKEKEKDY